jgi:CheY-like chemotaxis protein
VDDEEMIIEVGRAMLESLGYQVISAQSGKEAIEIFREQRGNIDLTVLDMIMPGMGGSETFDQLISIQSSARILLSSGYSINGQATEIMKKGASGFIQKPFNLEELSRKVGKLLTS